MAYQENSFPIEENRVNKTSGTVTGIALCVADGDLTVNWKSGTTATVSCVSGNAFNLKNAIDATIVSGTFHDIG